MAPTHGPRLFTSLYDAYVEGNSTDLAQKEETVRRFGDIYSVGPHSVSAIVARTKSALSLLGLCSDTTVEPIEKTDLHERAAIQSILQELDVNVAHCTKITR